MSISEFFLGKPESTEQIQKFTPEQQQSLNQLLSGAGEQLPQIFQFLQQILSQDPEMMSQFGAPAMRSFEEQTIPSIAERFSGMNAQRSSGFGQQLGQAGAALEENLSAQRAGMGSQAISQLQSLLQGGLTPQFETLFRPKTQGFLGQLAGGLGSAMGSAGSMGLSRLFGM